MRPYIPIISLLLSMAVAAATARGEDAPGARTVSHTDSVMIHFRQSKWNLDTGLGDNAASLDSIDRRLTTVLNDSVYRLRHVSVFGGASPEGSVSFNRFLSERRAETLFGWFDKYDQLSELDRTFTYFGRDWEGVLRLAQADPSLPWRDETVALLRQIAEEKRAKGGEEPAGSLERIKKLRGGEPYRYLYRHIFPAVRSSKVVIDYDRVLAPEVAARRPDTVVVRDTVFVERIVEVHDTVYIDTCHRGPFYMDVRTNMLYDALAVPNIGVEFYLGKNWSVVANWMYAWWKTDRRHRYWRVYGGDLAVRYWFGKAAHRKPLTGHHVGLYGGLLTYDFEWGGTGYMGGIPEGSLWDKCNHHFGVEYGYSLPIAKRLNIDFNIGVGYLGGEYREYKPIDGHYVWQATKKRHWFGPTKIEVSLVWLIGRGNTNSKKGGAI